MRGSCSLLNPIKVLTAVVSHGVHLKIATVSTSLFILSTPCRLPPRCTELEREREVVGRGVEGWSTTVIPYLSNIVYEWEMKRGGLEQWRRYTLFVLIRLDMHGRSDCTQSGHIWPISHRLATSMDHYAWWIQQTIVCARWAGWWNSSLQKKYIQPSKLRRKYISKVSQSSLLSLPFPQCQIGVFAVRLSLASSGTLRWPKVGNLRASGWS